MFLAACGESVEFEEEVNIDEQTLTIEGETTLGDGSIIDYEVIDFEGGEILVSDQTKVQTVHSALKYMPVIFRPVTLKSIQPFYHTISLTIFRKFTAMMVVNYNPVIQSQSPKAM